MAIDWNSKSTAHLLLCLGSLLRHEKNAKKMKEIEAARKSIEEIKAVLKNR